MTRQDSETPQSQAPEKQPYSSPRLTVYGDLRRITMGEKGKLRVDSDTGVASTKR